MMNFTKCYSVFHALLFLWSVSAFATPPDLLEEMEGKGPCVTRDLQIPIGKVEDAILYLDIPMGTSIADVPAQIAQKRALSGLSPMISLKDQITLKTLPWKVQKIKRIKAFFPAYLDKVFVTKGQEVKDNERLCELEFMKMLHTVSSPFPGKVVFALAQGEILTADTVVLILAPLVPQWIDIDPPNPLQNKVLFTSIYPWESPSQPQELLAEKEGFDKQQINVCPKKGTHVHQDPLARNGNPLLGGDQAFLAADDTRLGVGRADFRTSLEMPRAALIKDEVWAHVRRETPFKDAAIFKPLFESSLKNKPCPWLQSRALGLPIRGSSLHHGQSFSYEKWISSVKSQLRPIPYPMEGFQNEEKPSSFLLSPFNARERLDVRLNLAPKIYPEKIMKTSVAMGEDQDSFPSQCIAFLLSSFFLIVLRLNRGGPGVTPHSYCSYDAYQNIAREPFNQNNSNQKLKKVA